MVAGLWIAAGVIGAFGVALARSGRGAMAEVEVVGGQVRVTVRGAANRALAFRGHLEVPLDHVAGVHRYGADDTGHFRGVRVPGANLPGVVTAGTYRGPGGKAFYAIHKGDKAVVIECRDDYWERIVVEVDEPDALVHRLQTARTPALT